MDKFVIRPDGKNMIGSPLSERGNQNRTSKISIKNTNSKPQIQSLTEKQIINMTSGISQKMMLDAIFKQISPSNCKHPVTLSQPLVYTTTSESSADDCSSIPMAEIENDPLYFLNHMRRKRLASDVTDYVTPEQTKSGGDRITIRQALPKSIPFLSDKVQFDDLGECPKKPSSNQSKPKVTNDIPKTPNSKNNGIMARIQRDINSPSASVRLRAMRALQNPQNADDYTKFDVPHEEQPIITADDLKSPPPLPSIRDVMRDVIVYAEVRTGEDNRTAGIKKVISALGARVNDRLLRDTTHVVFKDGLLSTYKKAKQWNIPIVSILWVEECKKQCKLCDPKDFPISDLDRYEYPELYEKMKRRKAMQPESECNKRIRLRTGTPKDGTPKTVKFANDPQLTKDRMTPTSNGNKKTDISQYFISNSSNNRNNGGDIEENEKIEKNCDGINNETVKCKSRQIPKNKVIVSTIINHNIETEPFNKHNGDECKDNEKDDKISALPINNGTKRIRPTRRRNSTSSVLQRTPTQHSQQSTINNNNNNNNNIDGQPDNINKTEEKLTPKSNKSSINEKVPMLENHDTELTPKPKIIKSVQRRTTFTNATMDISTVVPNTNTESEKKHNLRRTLYTPRKIIEDTLMSFEDKSSNTSNNNNNLEQTINKEKEFTPQQIGTLMEEQPSTITFSSTRKPGNRRTLFDMSIDLITERLHTINKSARRSTAARNVVSDSILPQQDHQPGYDHTPKRSGSEHQVIRRELFNVEQNDPKNDNDTITVELRDSPTAIKSSGIKKRKLYVPTISDLSSIKSDISISDNDSSTKIKKTVNGSVNIIKKRKLYVPESCESSSASTVTLTNANVNELTRTKTTENKNDNNNRRRRTLMPVVNQINENIQGNNTNSINNETYERTESAIEIPLSGKAKPSSLENNEVQLNMMKQNNELNIQASNRRISNTINEQINHVQKMSTDNSNKQLINANELTGRSQHDLKRNIRFLVYTNMHTKQTNIIREVIENLGGFILEEKVNNRTTHIVSLEARRTLNLLRGLIRGIWILDYKWITDSREAQRWLPEEPYELKSFSRAVEICRAENQAFGKDYRCELFTGLGSFFIGERCGPIKRADLIDLIYLCGGKMTEYRKRAKYIVCNTTRYGEDKNYVTAYWILDSITHMQLMRLQSYLPETKIEIPRNGQKSCVQATPSKHAVD